MNQFIQVYLIGIVVGGLCFTLLPVFHLLFKDSPRIKRMLEDETWKHNKVH